MLRLIEKNFFMIAQRIGLFFATVSFVAVIVLGYVSFEKINTKASDKIDAPVIDFAKYQNPISAQQESINKIPSSKISQDEGQDKINKAFDTHIDAIVESLEQLPDNVIDKVDLAQKVKILVKIKANPYSQELQLAYANSLSKLIQQMVNVGGAEINVDEFIKWHHKEFATQVNNQNKNNLLKMGNLKTEQTIGYIALGMTFGALGIFIMFVMMLVMLRIEKNTRK
ncbi:MAG TPA: hypothetical protein EYO74_08450 [Piscirickettsiaceae bacterium]|jgi:hypothetical protein|nr:hypothetical protein [Piscirickettsiaceae bacterium]